MGKRKTTYFLHLPFFKVQLGYIDPPPSKSKPRLGNAARLYYASLYDMTYAYDFATPSFTLFPHIEHLLPSNKAAVFSFRITKLVRYKEIVSLSRRIIRTVLTQSCRLTQSQSFSRNKISEHAAFQALKRTFEGYIVMSTIQRSGNQIYLSISEETRIRGKADPVKLSKFSYSSSWRRMERCIPER